MREKISADPIRLELIKNAIGSVVDEMMLTVVRIAYSSIMKDTMDLSSAFCDRRGQMVAQGLSLPIHLGSFPAAMEVVCEKFGDSVEPGDIIILNDPYHGGMHLPDVFMIKPIFQKDHLFGYAVVVAHHNDIGGRVPGSSAADSTEVFQEGLRIPPIKLYVRGVLNQAVQDIILLNVRIPTEVRGDLQAQVAACRIAERGMIELAERYGIDELEFYFGELLDYSERGARRAIDDLPDGTYRYTDYLDDDGIDPDVPVNITVAITVAGDAVRVDFTGTSPQVRGAINSTLSFAQSAVYFALRAIMKTGSPSNAGFFRPIEVIAPLGCLLNPKPPAAVAARGVSGVRAIDTLFGALAQAVPERVRAAGEGGTTSYSLASTDSHGRFTLFREAIMGAWGAGYQREGIDGVANPAINTSNAPIEVVENQAAVRVERYEFVTDSGGAGQWRGGLSVVRQVRFLGVQGTLQLRSDRRRHRPYGLAGGADGAASNNELGEADGHDMTWRQLPTKFTRAIHHGQVLRHTTAGGGGYGDPLRRDPEAVLADVSAGKVTPEAAADTYGVSVIPHPWRIDGDATEALRARRND